MTFKGTYICTYMYPLPYLYQHEHVYTDMLVMSTNPLNSVVFNRINNVENKTELSKDAKETKQWISFSTPPVHISSSRVLDSGLEVSG